MIFIGSAFLLGNAEHLEVKADPGVIRGAKNALNCCLAVGVSLLESNDKSLPEMLLPFVTAKKWLINIKFMMEATFLL